MSCLAGEEMIAKGIAEVPKIRIVLVERVILARIKVDSRRAP